LDGENRATWGFGKKRSEEESGAGEWAEGRAAAAEGGCGRLAGVFD